MLSKELVSTLQHMQYPWWDRARCPEEYASSVGMPRLLKLFFGNLSQWGKTSNYEESFQTVVSL